MSVVAPLLPEARVLDLFAGSGALGLEALSRGAARAVFVEQAGSAVKALQANIDALGAGSRSEVFRGDALRYVSSLGPGAFDLAFADPPYDTRAAAAVVEAFAAIPFASWLCVEHSRDDVLPQLPGARTRRYGDTQLTFIPEPE
jgi:16S rRNA (guanine966-N2)-methyltransferase